MTIIADPIDNAVDSLKTLVEAALLAPSGDNMQPWWFEIDNQNSSITIRIDETADPSPMNQGQRMSRIACGAALENIVQTAAHNGWQIETQEILDRDFIARVIVTSKSDSKCLIPETIRNRCTNRKLYNSQPLTKAQGKSVIGSVPSENGIEIVWCTEHRQLSKWSKAIGQADAQMMSKPKFLRAFLSNIRFDLQPNEVANEGLSIGSLEISHIDRQLMSVLRYVPEWILKLLPLRGSFRKHSEKLVRNSSGICYLIPQYSGPDADLATGRTMQRLWLALTAAGFQVQPMMSIPVLANVGKLDLTSLPDWPPNSLPPIALLRFGIADAPTVRCGRDLRRFLS